MSAPDCMLKKTQKKLAAAPVAVQVSYSVATQTGTGGSTENVADHGHNSTTQKKELRRTAEEFDEKWASRIRISAPNETMQANNPTRETMQRSAPAAVDQANDEIDDNRYLIQSLPSQEVVNGSHADRDGESSKLKAENLLLENLEMAEKMSICFPDIPQSSHLENYWGNEGVSSRASGENTDEESKQEIDDLMNLAIPHLSRSRNIPAMTTVPGAHHVAGIDGSNVQGAGECFDADEQQHFSTTENDTFSVQPNVPIELNVDITGLAIAREVVDASDADLMQAEELDPADLERKSAATKNQMKNFILRGLLVMTIVVVAAVLGLAFGLVSKDTTATPTMIPSLAPTAMPSFAPSSIVALLLQDLPDYTLESIKIYSTPQWNAIEWLLGHPELPVMPEWRKKQLFALATFYHAMEGPHWPKLIRENWMLYEKSECFWFSNEFGGFADGSIGWTALSWYNVTPCNDRGEFQVLLLVRLDLANYFPCIPPEISFLTSLFKISLPVNGINSSLTEFLPSQIYQMSNLLHLSLRSNLLSGEIPSQFGLMTNMVELGLYENALSGPIPTELGSMTSMTILYIYSNHGLTGEIPSQFGLMTNMVDLALNANALSGPIPTELGLMTSMTLLLLDGNGLSGEIPSQFGLMTNMKFLLLKNNSLTGTIPSELDFLGVNGSLIIATFANNTLLGTVPAGLCSMGLWSEGFAMGLSFDCVGQLCGCCWCPCPGSYTSVDCQTKTFLPSNDENWPGRFPVPLNTTNVVIINLVSDDFPEDTTLEWSIQEVPDGWKILVLHDPQEIKTLHSYTMQVVSNATYRLQVFDSYGDGTCCGMYGLGWLTITNSTPSDDHSNGTVLWEALGDFGSSLEVLLWIDPHGHAQQVEDVP